MSGGAPSPPDSPALPRNLVLYDGHCGLCDATVRALLRLDRHRRLVFAPLQGESGRRIAERLGLAEEPRSIAFLHRTPSGEVVALERSRAILAILTEIGGLSRLAAALGRIVPARLGDVLYNVVAARRYRWFGRRESCRLPAPGESGRFLP